ncbi:MAG: right-handed parallel beta-helix repeat-containing protein, partial [Eubacterium sp.]
VKCVRDDVLPSRTVTVDLSTTNSEDNMRLLNNALAQATDSEQLIVKVKTAGTYYIASAGSALKLRSNTTLDLNGSTLIRSGSMYNLFQNSDFNGDTDGTGYTLTKNIGLKNGTLDGSGGSPEQANLVNFGHATGITIENVNFKNCHGGHLIELTGCKDCVISNCTFTGFIGSAGVEDNEAIQLDICNNNVAGSWNGVYYSDSTVCSNITVDGCTFYDYPSGVGNHHTITGVHSNNINITNNKFLNTMNTSQPAIWCYDFIDSVVSGNTVSGNYSCGIKVSAGSVDVIDNTVKGVAYDAVYITKSNSYVQGKTNVTSEEYAYNCSVKNNTLSTSGAHVALSIFSGSGVVEVSGNNISATGESALVISGVDTSVSSVKSNTFKSTSAYGILVASNAKVTSITANTITGKLHGIQVSSNANVSTISNNSSITATSGSGVYVSGATATTISGNTIKNCGESGICVSSTGVTSTVQSNSISGCGEYGIRINNSSLTVNVSKNTFSKNSSGSMYIKAKGTIQSS